MNDQELISYIVKTVLEKLQEISSTQDKRAVGDGKRILALFSGGLSGAEEARQAIMSLSQDGHRIQAIFTPNAEHINGSAWLKEAAPAVHILPVNFSGSPLKILEETDLVVIPVLTHNSAAKLACGIADNPATSLAAFALMRGIPLIAAGDACHTESVTPYSIILNDNCRNLEELGVHFTPAHSLAERCSFRNMESAMTGNRITQFDEKLLSADIVRGWTHDRILLPKGVVITPAAKDAAIELGIRLLPQDE